MFHGSLPTEQELYGTWEVVEAEVSKCDASDGANENLKGVQFTLHEDDEVTWKLTKEAANDELPFFSCETYEVILVAGCCVESVSKLRFYGKKFESWIEFNVSSTPTKLILAHDQYLELFCTKVTKACLDVHNPPYSLLGALQEGFFTDLTLTSRTGEKFAVHKTVLSCKWPTQDWDVIPAFMRALPSDVLRTLLHYLYSDSLPNDVTEDTARETLKVVSAVQGLEKLTQLCTDYLEASAVKLRINSLVYELDQSLCSAVKVVRDLCPTLYHGQSGDHSEFGPSRIFDAGKTILREIATASLRFILVCEIFTKRKAELTREERHDIIKSVKDRLPEWSRQLHSMLSATHACLSQLTDEQKDDIAKYLIPEIESAWETMTTLGNNTRSALEQIVQAADGESREQRRKQKRHRTGSGGSGMGTKLSRTLRNAIHIKEVTILKKLQEKVTESFIFLIQKREDFSSMSQGEKVRAVVKSINKLAAEIPYHIQVLERFPQTNKLSFKECKYLFKVGSARVSWTLERVKRNQPALLPLIQTSRDLVKQEAFESVLVELGLTRTDGLGRGSPPPEHQPLNYNVDSLTTPPRATDSDLAREVTALLESGKHADMTFTVSGSSTETSDCGTRPAASCVATGTTYQDLQDHNQEINELNEKSGYFTNENNQTTAGSTNMDIECKGSDAGREESGVEFRAHRVILAARCDWFKRALLSGMKESIDRKISIPDTNPELFRCFLWSMYCGTLDTNDMPTEQLAELMTLTDQYEVVSIKQACEVALCSRISDDSVLVLLSLADRYTASHLKEEAMAFIRENPTITSAEEFDELQLHLQQEVTTMLQQNMCGGTAVVEDVRQAFEVCGIDEFDDLFPRSNPPSVEPRETRVEQCIRALADVLGDVPRRELIRITLAADCDVNRALNFYFA